MYESSCSTRYVEKKPGKFVADTKCKKLPIKACISTELQSRLIDSTENFMIKQNILPTRAPNLLFYAMHSILAGIDFDNRMRFLPGTDKMINFSSP